MLREQIVDVAVFKFGKDNQIELKEVFPNILIQSNFNVTPVPKCVLDQDYAAIIVNYKNKGYCRMRFDTQTQKNLIKHLRNVSDSQTRCYIWRTFKDMIHNNQGLISSEWFELLMLNLQDESEEITI